VGIKGEVQGKKLEGVRLHLESEVIFQRTLGEMIILNGAGYILKEMEVTVIFQRTQKGQRGSAGGVHGSGTGAEQEGRSAHTGGRAEWRSEVQGG
jgi:hypothetical protein